MENGVYSRYWGIRILAWRFWGFCGGFSGALLMHVAMTKQNMQQPTRGCRQQCPRERYDQIPGNVQHVCNSERYFSTWFICCGWLSLQVTNLKNLHPRPILDPSQNPRPMPRLFTHDPVLCSRSYVHWSIWFCRQLAYRTCRRQPGESECAEAALGWKMLEVPFEH